MLPFPISLPFISQSPLRVVVNRNGAAESVHEIDIAVCNAAGDVICGFGEVESEIFPRSAMKPLQAIALLEQLSSSAAWPALSDAEIAILCASHNGEEIHSQAVAILLQKFDIAADELICGAHWSLDQESLIEQVRTLKVPDKTHNNCSGKHAGMLILSKLLTGDTAHYAEINHIAQQHILHKLEQMTGAKLDQNITAIDGCGAPVFRAPLHKWAKAFALFAGGGEVPTATQQACQTIRKSIATNPYMLAGRNRACSAINAAYAEAVTVKVGAEGVYSAAFHDLQLGLMLKTRDGSKRGAEVALGVVFQALGLQIDARVEPFFSPIICNWAGTAVGDITVEIATD